MVQIKIMGGQLKGVSLFFPKEKMRPTSSLLKRRFFDAYQNFSSDYFIDLCAGSGSIGIEAWSRGARGLILIEKNFAHVSVIEKNIKIMRERLPQEIKLRPIRLVKEDCLQVDKILKNLKNDFFEKNDNGELTLFIFFDPPYEDHDLYNGTMEEIKKIFKGNEEYQVKFVIESCQDKGVSLEKIENIMGRTDNLFKQGTKFIAIFDL